MGDVNGGPPQQSMLGGNQRFLQPQGFSPGLRGGGFGQAVNQMQQYGGGDPKGGPGGGLGMQQSASPMGMPQMSQPGMQQSLGDLRGAMTNYGPGNAMGVAQAPKAAAGGFDPAAFRRLMGMQ